jgi:hypothetical protein
MAERLTMFSVIGPMRLANVSSGAEVQVKVYRQLQDEESLDIREEESWEKLPTVDPASSDDGFDAIRATVQERLYPDLSISEDRIRQVLGYDFTDPAEVAKRSQQYSEDLAERRRQAMADAEPESPGNGHDSDRTFFGLGHKP